MNGHQGDGSKGTQRLGNRILAVKEKLRTLSKVAKERSESERTPPKSDLDERKRTAENGRERQRTAENYSATTVPLRSTKIGELISG